MTDSLTQLPPFHVKHLKIGGVTCVTVKLAGYSVTKHIFSLKFDQDIRSLIIFRRRSKFHRPRLAHFSC